VLAGSEEQDIQAAILDAAAIERRKLQPHAAN
jgi:hypothetical protein